ncbi:hypothetical protein D3C83_289130 [compost metagenome]
MEHPVDHRDQEQRLAQREHVVSRERGGCRRYGERDEGATKTIATFADANIVIV